MKTTKVALLPAPQSAEMDALVTLIYDEIRYDVGDPAEGPTDPRWVVALALDALARRSFHCPVND